MIVDADPYRSREAMASLNPLGRLAPRIRADRGEATPPADAFSQVVALHRDNEALLKALKQGRGRIARALAYLADPSCNVNLALANLERLRDRRSADLARLRANRVVARKLLATPPAPQGPHFGLGFGLAERLTNRGFSRLAHPSRENS